MGEHFEKFISNEIKSGRYASASEVIRTALRLLEDEEKKLKLLTKALITGETSALRSDFDPQAHLQSLRKKRG